MRRLVQASAFLMLAPAAALGAEESVNVVPNDIGLWIWTLAAFLVMFALLARLAFKPIAEALDRRAKAIQQSLADAQKDREEAKNLMTEYRRQIAEARSEAAKLIEEARAMGESVRRDVVEKAKAEASAVMERAGEEIRLQKEKGLQDLRETVAALSVQIASRVIEKEVSEASHRQMVDNLIKDLSGISKAS